MYYKINNYCYRLSKHIKNFDDKYTIVEEIKEHMTEYVSALIKKGISENDAQKKAIKDMGNLYILAFRLNIAHKAEVLPKINYYKTERIKPAITLPGFGEWVTLNETKNGSLMPGNIFFTLKLTYMERLGLSPMDMIKGLITVAMILIIVSGGLFMSSKFRYYKNSDIYDFGKLYNTTPVEYSHNDTTTEYIYNINNITSLQIKDYKTQLRKKGYKETKYNTLINDDNIAVNLTVDNDKLIVAIFR